ncbi:MAG TPA: threonine/serine dehydratase [Roseiflexaceae bacterium]|nr:threonine/serine dehydratase [Roseiflexaceae bacterium]
MLDLFASIQQAEQRIRPYIRETPLEESLALSQISDADVLVKLENLQHTGSFKLRGALNKLLSLAPDERARGVVAASSGNHGAALAYALRLLGAHGTIFVPEHASPVKVAAMQRYGARVERHGDDSVITEAHARRYADEHGMAYVSPYNDLAVVSGQGTIGVELARQTEHLDAVFVSVGGGGLAAGIAGYLKTVWPHVRIVGCLPENSPVMARSVAAGQIVDMSSLPTLSDGTAGGIEPGAITFALCQQLIDEFVLVSEEQIAAAMRVFIEAHHMLIEGAAGVAVAGYSKQQQAWRGQRVAIIICGANISVSTLKTAL